MSFTIALALCAWEADSLEDSEDSLEDLVSFISCSTFPA